MDDKIPFECKADKQLFRAKTMNQHLIMGRKTYMSLDRPLEDRNIIVVSSLKHSVVVNPNNTQVKNPVSNEPTAICESLDHALGLFGYLQEVWICGGRELYKEALPIAHHLYLTMVNQSVKPNKSAVYFPPIDWRRWHRNMTFKSEEYNFYSYYNERNLAQIAYKEHKQ